MDNHTFINGFPTIRHRKTGYFLLNTFDDRRAHPHDDVGHRRYRSSHQFSENDNQMDHYRRYLSGYPMKSPTKSHEIPMKSHEIILKSPCF